MKKLILHVLIFFSGILCFYYGGLSFEYSDLKDYLSILLSVSSMVFTIMGIWIAFLYPNALSRLMDPDKIENADFSESLGEAKRLEGLVGSVLMSALVVVAIMLIFLLKVIFFKTDLYLANRAIVKSATISAAITLSIIQAQSIFYVIYSNVMFINDLHTKREDKEADADI